MKIINKISDPVYIQWIEQFVERVVQESKISCKEVIIKDFEYSRNIDLSIDGEKYDIRTWDFHPIKKDEQNHTCSEIVDYILFRIINDGITSHGEEICRGSLMIEWKN